MARGCEARSPVLLDPAVTRGPLLLAGCQVRRLLPPPALHSSPFLSHICYFAPPLFSPEALRRVFEQQLRARATGQSLSSVMLSSGACPPCALRQVIERELWVHAPQTRAHPPSPSLQGLVITASRFPDAISCGFWRFFSGADGCYRTLISRIFLQGAIRSPFSSTVLLQARMRCHSAKVARELTSVAYSLLFCGLSVRRVCEDSRGCPALPCALRTPPLVSRGRQFRETQCVTTRATPFNISRSVQAM